MPRNLLLEFRRDTAANWTAANPVLAAGEPGWESDTNKLKIGDGSTAWAGLAYFAGGGSGVSTLDGISGAVTLHAGTNVTITDNSPGAGQIDIAAAGGTGAVKLFDSTLGAPAASIDTGAGGIAGGHGDLMVWIIARSSRAANDSDAANLTFNNDTAANYDRQEEDGSTNNGATGSITYGVQLAQTSIQLGIPAALVTASYPAVWRLSVPSYDQTTFFKMGETSGGWMSQLTTGALTDQIDLETFVWRNTAAITRMTIACANGNFLTGSRLVVYGLQ